MNQETVDKVILRFFRDDIGGILITGDNGEVLYSDAKTDMVLKGETNWKAACPPPREGQKNEAWDLLHYGKGKTYMIVTSAFGDEGGLKQIHHLVDTSLYMELYKEAFDYSRKMKEERDHDRLTGLYNRNKFMEMKRTLFSRQEHIAVFNMDVNDLKHMNDNVGHEAGDRLLIKAAESMKRIQARNIIPFRIGGDEFVVVALHVDLKGAEKIREDWERALDELNRAEDGIICVVACGFAYGEKGHQFEKVLAEADRRMYEDKRAKKAQRGQPKAT